MQTFNTMTNPILASDCYKYTHWLQYPEGTKRVYSYLESRGGKFDKTVVFGIQYYTNLLSQIRITQEHIEEAEETLRNIFGFDGYFNREGWEIIVNEHDGRIPLEIRAVPEGTNLPTRNVIATMVNTDDRLPWLTNFFETLLLKVWYPITVATQSRKIKELLQNYADQTGGEVGPFSLNDFGYRGVSSEESAGIGAAAHLVNFWGTDTVAGIRFANQYYNADASATPTGMSVFATEHSTTTIHGRENEHEAMIGFIERAGKVNPQAIVSLVSDSYDIHRTVERMANNIRFRTAIMQHGLNGGRVVVRPDSGDPAEMALACLNGLSDGFVPEINDKGYKVLPPEIGIIYGDGINYDSIDRICRTLMESGWSIHWRNIVFGMGGGLLQQVDRDTQKFAFKCCAAQDADGNWFDVYKDPISDKGKGSKRGRMKLISIDTANGLEYSTVPHDHPAEDIMRVVYRDGEQMNTQDFQDIRDIVEGV